MASVRPGLERQGAPEERDEEPSLGRGQVDVGIVGPPAAAQRHTSMPFQPHIACLDLVLAGLRVTGTIAVSSAIKGESRS